MTTSDAAFNRTNTFGLSQTALESLSDSISNIKRLYSSDSKDEIEESPEYKKAFSKIMPVFQQALDLKLACLALNIELPNKVIIAYVLADNETPIE